LNVTSNAAKSFDILAAHVVLHNYFHSIKIIFRSAAKFLDTSAKLLSFRADQFSRNPLLSIKKMANRLHHLVRISRL